MHIYVFRYSRGLRILGLTLYKSARVLYLLGFDCQKHTYQPFEMVKPKRMRYSGHRTCIGWSQNKILGTQKFFGF